MKERKNKKMEKLKNKKVGRPKYQPNIEQLQELYSEIRKGNMNNEECWKIARLQKNIMVQDEKRTGGKK